MDLGGIEMKTPERKHPLDNFRSEIESMCIEGLSYMKMAGMLAFKGSVYSERDLWKYCKSRCISKSTAPIRIKKPRKILKLVNPYVIPINGFVRHQTKTRKKSYRRTGLFY